MTERLIQHHAREGEWGWLEPRLLQRLQRAGTGSAASPFAFGGGGSGFSADAVEEIDKLWTYDYMGAAEYEFGAPCKAMHDFCLGFPCYVEFQLEVSARVREPLVRVPLTFRGMCHREHEVPLKKWLRAWAEGGSVRIRDGRADIARIAERLHGGKSIDDERVVAWMDFVNCWVATIDEGFYANLGKQLALSEGGAV